MLCDSFYRVSPDVVQTEMGERMRRYSSKWDHKKKPELPLQHTRDISPVKRDKFVTNESQRAWHLQQVDCDNVGKHDKSLKETGGSTILDAPLPWDEHESYSTRMSPGLDDWRRQKHKRSPESGWYNSSYRNVNRKQSRSPPSVFNQDKRIDGRRATIQSHNLLSGRHTRSEFPLDIAQNDTKSLKTSRYPIIDGQKVESSDIRNGKSETLVASAQERPRKVSRQREIGRDMDAFLFEQKREFEEPYRSNDLPSRYIFADNSLNGEYSRSSHVNPTARSQNDERRNLTLNKFEKYTNQNLGAGIIISDINEREEQHNWAIEKRIPEETDESWLEGMEISSPWNPRESSNQHDPNKAMAGTMHNSYNAPRQNIQNDNVVVSNPSTLNFTIENQQMLQSTHILPVVDMNEAQEKELREAKTTRFKSPSVEKNNLRACSEVSLSQKNHSHLVTFSPSLAQLTGDRQQLSQPYTALNFCKSLESIVSSTNNSMVKCSSEVQLDKEGEKSECLNLIAVDCSSTMGKVNDTNDPDTEENKIGGEANLSPENENGNNNDEMKTTGNNKKGIRAFKFALAEFVKEILKPKWKDCVISKDSYKAIVKKVVDKVMTSIPQARIPRSQDKITNYLSSSESKLSKLVQAYVDKHHKN